MSERYPGTRVRYAVWPASLLVFLVTAPAALGATIYVDINAECGGAGQPICDGQSWCTALKAVPDAQGGNEVLVADGTYRGPGPTLGFYVRSGVVLKGGYAGCSDPAAPRNIAAYETILDGDLLENDGEVAIECDFDSDCTAVQGQGDTCDNEG